MPAAAQDMSDTPALEDLIPDSAVLDPEAWAAQGADGAPEEVQQISPLVEADTPLPEMPQITVPWPEDLELAEVEPLEAEDPPVEFAVFEDVIQQAPIGSEEKISDELVLVFPSETSLFPERDEFLDRFKSLSTIEELQDEDNPALLRAQARSDEELLNTLLQIYGYYDAQVIRSVGNVDQEVQSDVERPAARFDIIPGRRYAYGAIDLGPLDGKGQAYEDYGAMRAAFAIQPGDFVQQDDILVEQAQLDTALGESGYPFAEIDDPALLVDHERVEADLSLITDPKGQYRFGGVTSNLPDFMSSGHLEDIARFDAGELYQRSLEMDLRRAILATGIVGSVTLTPVETRAPTATEPGEVDIAVEMTEAPLRTLAGSIGYGTDEGFKLAGSWEHRNLFPPEGMLRVRGIAGTREQLAGVTFRKNNFKGRDRILTLDAFASTVDFDAYDARTISAVGTYEKVSNLLFQKPFSYSVGVELVATQEREADAEGNFGPRQTYFIAALPLYAQLDTSDDLLDPKEGWRLSGNLSPEISRTNGTESFYLRSQVDASYYQSVTDRVVLAGRGRLASIPGTVTANIAPSRRLYAGGGGSVRGYGYREIGPRNESGDPTGGRSLVEFSLEARIQTPLMDGAVGVVPFIDAGSVADGTTPDFRQIKFGAGIGARYNTGFGPLRLDVAVPLNPGPNDNWIAVYVALGQAF